METVANLTSIHFDSFTEFMDTEFFDVDSNSDAYSLPNWVSGVLLPIYSVFMLIAIGGNILICVLIWRKKKLRTVANYFVISLALSDIILVTLCVPFTVLTNLIFFHWVFGEFLCPVVGYFQLSSVIQRSFVLVAVAADRHQAVWRPMHKRLSKRGTLILIGVIWVISLVVPLPIAMYSKLQSFGSEQLCIEIWSSRNSRITYGIGMMIMTYALPLFVLFSTYASIVHILSKKAPGEDEAKRDRRRLGTKAKTIKTMIYVVMAYLVCWLPIHLITIIGDLNPSIYNNKTVHILWLCFHMLAMSNAASNPILYFTTNTVYRKTLVELWKTRKYGDQFAAENSSPNIFELLKRRISVSVGNFNNVYDVSKRRSTEILDLNRIRTSPGDVFRARKASVAWL